MGNASRVGRVERWKDSREGAGHQGERLGPDELSAGAALMGQHQDRIPKALLALPEGCLARGQTGADQSCSLGR